MNENNQVEQKLAGSLTAETTELIPYLPYLLQDIWELGSSPQDMCRLIRNHININSNTKVIDLGCGKGAVSVIVGKTFGVSIKGFDLLPDFIKAAREKAQEYDVEHLCEFVVQDINKTIASESGYDIAILGAVGDVLGEPAETLGKLKQIVSRNGYILIDEAYLVGAQDEVRYQNYEYLTLPQWKKLFHNLGLELIAGLTSQDTAETDAVNDHNNLMIRKRADELAMKYPDKKAVFEGYIKSQEMECEDLEDVIVGITWLLKRR